MAFDNHPEGRPDGIELEPILMCRTAKEATFWRYSLGPWTVIEAVGEIDLAAAPIMQELLDEAASSRVVIDVSRVSFMDASGLAVLAAAWRQGPTTGGGVRLVGPDERIRMLLRITNVDQLLPIYECLEDATI